MYIRINIFNTPASFESSEGAGTVETTNCYNLVINTHNIPLRNYGFISTGKWNCTPKSLLSKDTVIRSILSILWSGISVYPIDNIR